MNLSRNAKEYLEESKRVKSWVLSIEDIRSYLEYHSISNERICEIAFLYSGYHLRMEDGRKGLFIQLFSKNHIKKNWEPDIYSEDEKQYYSLGEHNTAQVNFVIDEIGAVYVATSRGYSIVSSSIEKYIEIEAYLKNITDFHRTECYYTIVNIEKFNNYVKRFYTKVKECSDEYNYIGKGQYGVICKGLFLGEDYYYCVVYSKSASNIDFVLNELKSNNII